jgi:hypothetical protein
VNDVLKCTCSRSVGSPRGPLARAGRRRLWVGAARAAGHQGHSLWGFWWLGRRACSDVSVTTSENTGRRCARTSYRRTCHCDSLVEGQPQPRRRGPRCRAGWASLGRRSHLSVSGARCDCGGGALRRALGSRRAQHAEVRDPAVLGAVRHVARRAGERGAGGRICGICSSRSGPWPRARARGPRLRGGRRGRGCGCQASKLSYFTNQNLPWFSRGAQRLGALVRARRGAGADQTGRRRSSLLLGTLRAFHRTCARAARSRGGQTRVCLWAVRHVSVSGRSDTCLSLGGQTRVCLVLDTREVVWKLRALSFAAEGAPRARRERGWAGGVARMGRDVRPVRMGRGGEMCARFVPGGGGAGTFSASRSKKVTSFSCRRARGKSRPVKAGRGRNGVCAGGCPLGPPRGHVREGRAHLPPEGNVRAAGVGLHAADWPRDRDVPRRRHTGPAAGRSTGAAVRKGSRGRGCGRILRLPGCALTSAWCRRGLAQRRLRSHSR